MRKIVDLSVNISKKRRTKNQIKFVIIHYTGMQSEIESIERLKDIKSKVSCHYLINRKGSVVQMVEEKNIAWHAGKSKWKNFTNLNKGSIGIELVNRGHKFGYENYTKLQINSLVNLCKELKKKYKINKENFLGHSDIAPLRKIDPGEKFPWKKMSDFGLGLWYKSIKKNYNFKSKNLIKKLFFINLYNIGYRYFSPLRRSSTDKILIKAFQRKYNPKKVTGKIDQKTFKISLFLSNQIKQG